MAIGCMIYTTFRPLKDRQLNKSTSQKSTQIRPHNLSVALSILALAVSGLSFWESHEARRINYETSLPAISATVELTEPLTAGKQIYFKVILDNFGRSPAKHMMAFVSYRFAPSGEEFKPRFANSMEES